MAKENTKKDLDQVVEDAMKRYYMKGIKERLKDSNLSSLRVAYYVLKKQR